MTAAGNFLEGTYTRKTSTEIADIETVKIHTNHIISSPGAKCCALDIYNMYLNTVLPTPEYTRIHTSMIPNNIRTEYGIHNDYVDNKGFVYFEITKAIYGLIQSGALAHADLKQHQNPLSLHKIKCCITITITIIIIIIQRTTISTLVPFHYQIQPN